MTQSQGIGSETTSRTWNTNVHTDLRGTDQKTKVVGVQGTGFGRAVYRDFFREG